MDKLLITGAGGFIGRHCLTTLAPSSREIHAVGRGTHDDLSDLAIWHDVDLFDRAAISALIERVAPTKLLHLAWCTEPGAYWTSLDNYRWVEASLHLFTEFARCDGRRVVGAGTCAEYAWGSDRLSESATDLAPATTYGACKRHTQGLLEAVCSSTGMSGAWGRVFFLYGPHEHPVRLVSSVIRSLLQGEPAHCTHGRQVRDFLYVEDVARAFVALLDSDVEGPVNIASGEPLALRDVIMAIADRLGAHDLVRLGALEAPDDEPAILLADARRLREEVGWGPDYTLDRGLDLTIAHWRKKLCD